MKKVLRVMGLVMVLAILATARVLAVTVQPATIEEKAQWGATLIVTIGQADLTNATVDATQMLSDFSINAKQSVELVAMRLVRPFHDTDGYSTATNTSLTMTVGDGSDADLYLTSTELCEDGTEVYLKLGRSPWQTATTTPTLQVQAFVESITVQGCKLYDSTGAAVTNSAGVHALAYTNLSYTTLNGVTNLTAATTVTQTDTAKLYTTADTIDFLFTPATGNALADMDVGEVRLYFRVFDAR